MLPAYTQSVKMLSKCLFLPLHCPPPQKGLVRMVSASSTLPSSSKCGSWTRSSPGELVRNAKGPISHLLHRLCILRWSQVIPMHVKVWEAQGDLHARPLFSIFSFTRGAVQGMTLWELFSGQARSRSGWIWESVLGSKSATILELKTASLSLICTTVSCYLLMKA